MEKAVKYNIASSIVYIGVSFAVNTLAQLFLISFLFEIGGWKFVGYLAAVQASIAMLLVLDIGLTNSLTDQFARENNQFAFEVLKGAVVLLSVLYVVAMVLTIIFAFVSGREVSSEVCLVLSASFSQIISAWISSIKIGKHEQYWLHVKSIVRILSYTATILIFYQIFGRLPLIVVPVGIFIGCLLELLFIFAICRADFYRFRETANCRIASPASVFGVVKGFGPATITQKLQEPVWRTLAVLFSGTSLLGVINVAWKIPSLASATLAEALRGILAGSSHFDQIKGYDSLRKLVALGVDAQLLIAIPISVFIFFHASTLLAVWIAEGQSTAVIITQIFAVSFAVVNINVPAFWALQALGGNTAISKITVISISFTVISLMVLQLLGQLTPIHLAIVLFVAQVSSSIATLIVAHLGFNLLVASLRDAHLAHGAVFFCISIALNFLIAPLLTNGLGNLHALSVAAGLNLSVAIASGMFFLSAWDFIDFRKLKGVFTKILGRRS